MTQEQAAAAADTSNTALGGGVTTVKFGSFPQFTGNYQKQWNVCLYNTQYDTAFGLATDSQLIAFARVSLQTIAIMSTGDSVDVFKANFNIKAAADTELAAYLEL